LAIRVPLSVLEPISMAAQPGTQRPRCGSADAARSADRPLPISSHLALQNIWRQARSFPEGQNVSPDRVQTMLNFYTDSRNPCTDFCFFAARSNQPYASTAELDAAYALRNCGGEHRGRR